MLFPLMYTCNGYAVSAALPTRFAAAEKHTGSLSWEDDTHHRRKANISGSGAVRVSPYGKNESRLNFVLLFHLRRLKSGDFEKNHSAPDGRPDSVACRPGRSSMGPGSGCGNSEDGPHRHGYPAWTGHDNGARGCAYSVERYPADRHRR